MFEKGTPVAHIAENTTKNTHQTVLSLTINPQEPNQKVLDIPSGRGAFTQALLNNNITVYSGDIENILEVENNDHFQVMDMDKPFPFEDNFLTEVVCIDGIEHIERQFDFIKECNRVIKPGGHVVISTPNVSSMRSRWRYLLTGHHNKCKTPLNEEHITFLHHKNMISFPELRYQLHTNGFEITDIKTNRIKGVSWLFYLLYPFSYLVTKSVYNKEEKEPGQRQRNKEIMRQMFSKAVYGGETLIVKAKKR